MNKARNRLVFLSLLGSVLSSVETDVVRADSLRARVVKDTFLLWEPVAIHVDLRFDDPVIVNFAEDIGEVERQLRRLPRRLTVKLCDEQGTEVSESILFGAEFARPERGEPASEFSACGLAFFEMLKIAKGGTWELDPGPYTIIVSGAGRLQSSAIAVDLVAAEGEDSEAAERFRASLPAGLGVILAKDDQAGAVSLFEDLARDYPDTVYGKYARTSLSLLRYRETFAVHNNKGGAAVWGSVARELATMEGVFAGQHPLREKVLFRLAIARVFSGDYAGARQTAGTLQEVFPNGKLASRSKQLEEEMAEFERQEASANNGDQ